LFAREGGWGHSSCERQLHAPESSPYTSLDTYYIYRLPSVCLTTRGGAFYLCVCLGGAVGTPLEDKQNSIVIPNHWVDLGLFESVVSLTPVSL